MSETNLTEEKLKRNAQILEDIKTLNFKGTISNEQTVRIQTSLLKTKKKSKSQNKEKTALESGELPDLQNPQTRKKSL